MFAFSNFSEDFNDVNWTFWVQAALESCLLHFAYQWKCAFVLWMAKQCQTRTPCQFVSNGYHMVGSVDLVAGF